MFWKQPPSQAASLKTPPRSPQLSHQNSNGSQKSPGSSNSLEVPIVKLSNITTSQKPSLQLNQSKPIAQKHQQHQQQSIQTNQQSPSSYDSDDSLEMRTLPANFEKQIRELEIIISASDVVDIDIVRSLIMLYTIGVEYYDSKSDDKFIYFKNKIVYLHGQQNVIDAMNNQTNPAVIKQKSKEESLFRDDQENSKQAILSSEEIAQQVQASKVKFQQIEEQSQVCITEADVHEILDTQDDLFLEQEILIEKDLKKQNNIIQKRLSKRIKANQLASSLVQSSSSSLGFSITPPRLIVTGVNQEKQEIFEKAIEKQTSIQSQNSFETRERGVSMNSPTKDMKNEEEIRKNGEFVLKKVDSIEIQRADSHEIDRQHIIQQFVSDKKRSLQEEMALKLEQLEFHFEKLIFAKERNSQSMDEATKEDLANQKRQKILEIEAEFAQREKTHLDMIYTKYNAVPPFTISNQQQQQDSK